MSISREIFTLFSYAQEYNLSRSDIFELIESGAVIARSKRGEIFLCEDEQKLDLWLKEQQDQSTENYRRLKKAYLNVSEQLEQLQESYEERLASKQIEIVRLHQQLETQEAKLQELEQRLRDVQNFSQVLASNHSRSPRLNQR